MRGGGWLGVGASGGVGLGLGGFGWGRVGKGWVELGRVRVGGLGVGCPGRGSHARAARRAGTQPAAAVGLEARAAHEHADAQQLVLEVGPRAVVEERLERLAVVWVRRVRLVLGARRASAVAPLAPPQLLVRTDAPLEVRVRGAVGVRRLVGGQGSGPVVRVRVRVRG
jgi:hypothetical protein